MTIDGESLVWVGIAATAIPSGVTGLLGFFAKRTLVDLERGIVAVGAEVKSLHSSYTSQDKGLALLEQRVAALEAIDRRRHRSDDPG